MRLNITTILVVACVVIGLLTDEVDAQRRNGNSGNQDPRVSSSPRNPSPRAQPSPRTQTPPTPRAQPSPRTQTPPTPRAQPSPRTQTPPTPTPRAQPSTRTQTQPAPTPRTDSPSRRMDVNPRTQDVPTRRVDPAPQPAPSSNRGSSRRRDSGSAGSAGIGDSRRRDAAGDSRVDPGTRAGSTRDNSSSDRGSRRIDSLKRYTDRRAATPTAPDSPSTSDSNLRRSGGVDSRGGSTPRVGSGAIPGSGFGGSGSSDSPTRRDATDGAGRSGGTDSPATPRSRNRTVFPESSDNGGLSRRNDAATERSRGNYGRGGLSTVTPSGRAGQARSTGAVAGERVSADAPTPRIRSGVDAGARLAPITPTNSSGRSDGSGERAGSGRRDLRAGYFRGAGYWGLDRRDGNHGHHDHGSVNIYFGFGGGRDYCGSYLYGPSYASYWDYWSFGISTPYHRGYSSPAHVYFGYQSDFRSHARYHFGYSSYLPCSRRSPYPFYRTRYWQPWYVDHWADVCPTYRTYHVIYEDYYVTDSTYYVETSDPYVDEEVLIPVSSIDNGGYVDDAATPVELSGGVPVAFQRTFADGVPLDLGYDELLAWGEEALYSADYLAAAEAFRRSAKLRWEDDYPKFQLALALFGAERYDLAYLALELGLDQNPAWLYRRFDLRVSFSSPEEFATRLGDLERYLIRNDRNDEARFLLGYLYYFSDNLFGARSVVRILGESSSSRFRHLDILAREAEKRILREKR